MLPMIKGIDHIVITVSNISKSCHWYETMLGMQVQKFISPSDPTTTRVALVFGEQKINLHEKNMQVTPVAQHPQPGCIDLCLWTDQPVTSVLAHWQDSITAYPEYTAPLVLEHGECIVQRTGARGPLKSVYIYDADGNLIEVSNRVG